MMDAMDLQDLKDEVAIAMPVPRGCGMRKKGGVYAECGLSPDGKPLEEFLLEGLPLPPDLQVTPLGVTLVEIAGVWHVVDWVGEEHYPNVADVLEEIRRFGMSRRLPRSLDFSKLTKKSMHLLVHARGSIENVAEYGDLGACPRGETHADGETCVAAWYHDIEGGEPIGESDSVQRKIASTMYEGKPRPENVTPKYKPAFIAAMPLSRLVVVEGTDDVQEKFEAISKSGLPTAVVPE